MPIRIMRRGLAWGVCEVQPRGRCVIASSEGKIMRIATGLGALLLLAACEGTVTTTTGTPAFTPSPEAAAAPARPGAFDGTWRGTWRATLDLNGRCAAPTLNASTLTIRGEQVRLVHPPTGNSAEGTIGPDGVFSLRGTIGRFPAGVAGVVEGGQLRGAVRSRECHFDFRMRRVG
jgi:hypothetical protein